MFRARSEEYYRERFAEAGLALRELRGVDPAPWKTRFLPHYAALPRWVRVPALAYHVLQLNSSRKPFTDLKVRQAISCAVDRQQVLDTAALSDQTIIGGGSIVIQAAKK